MNLMTSGKVKYSLLSMLLERATQYTIRNCTSNNTLAEDNNKNEEIYLPILQLNLTDKSVSIICYVNYTKWLPYAM